MPLDSDLDMLPQGPPRRRRRRHVKRRATGWRRAGKIAAIFVLIAVVLLAGTAVALYKYVNDQFEGTHAPSSVTPVDELPPEEKIKGTRNILVVGSDRRDVIEGGDRKLRQFKKGDVEGQRSDTMMIIQLRDGGKSAIGLSFPRDLRVQIPGKTGWHKINSSYAGGPKLVMDTIRSLTGLKIHNYVEVNYSSFRKIVDAVGGVKLCVTRAYEDAQSGLYVRRPGCYNFDGNKALAFVRMRKSDPEGDFGRIKRQQQFMRELMSKVKDIGFITNPARVIRTAQAVRAGVTTDQDLSLGLIRTIAGKLSGYSQANVDFRTVPAYPDIVGGISYVVMDEQPAQQLFTAMVESQPLPDVGKTSQSIPGPADVTFDLRNASGVDGAGRAWADRLKDIGFTNIRKIESADVTRQRTQIAFAPGAQLKAKLLSEYFADAELVQSVNLGRVVDAVVLLGRDHAAEALASASPSPAAS